MKRTLCASLFLLWLLAACGPAITPAAAPAAATATPAPPPTTAPSPTAMTPPTTAPSPTAVTPPTTAPSPTSVPPSPTVPPPTAVSATSTPVPATPVAIKNEFIVNVKNFEFMPRDIKVAAGTTVTWSVLQGPHTTTSDDFRTKGPNSWHSGDLATGQKYSVVFKTPGTYRFFCGFHSEPGAPLTPGNMNGTVTVQ